MILTQYVRVALERILDRRGYLLRQKDEPPRGFERFLNIYRQLGPTPEVVFDIGVGNGTPWLYEAFPDAHFVLVEPLRDFAPKIDLILSRYSGEVHYCALAEQEGQITIHVPLKQATGASLLRRDPEYATYAANRGDGLMGERIVPVSTLEKLAGEDLRPHIVKIDVEGAELQVMRGGQRCISTADMVIVECSVTSRYMGEAGFIDIGWHLQSEGFVLVDIVEMSTYGNHHMLAYLDAVFVKKDNPLIRPLTVA
jgi:FkbM family methyltransferase